MRKRKFKLVAHIPHGSGDAEWRIMLGRKVVAIIDPDMTMLHPELFAERVTDILNYEVDLNAWRP